MTKFIEIRSAPRFAAMIEALKQNWESARYHESRRWRFIYYYYFGLGSALIYYHTKLISDASLLPESYNTSLFFALIFLFLTLLGIASLGHLLYSNLEYGNHIKAIQYICEDLRLNKNISENRTRDKDIHRSAYMALPLGLNARGVIPFLRLSIMASAFTGSFSILLFLWSFAQFYKLESNTAINFFKPVLPVYSFALIYAVLLNFWRDKEIEAKTEREIREP